MQTTPKSGEGPYQASDPSAYYVVPVVQQHHFQSTNSPSPSPRERPLKWLNGLCQGAIAYCESFKAVFVTGFQLGERCVLQNLVFPPPLPFLWMPSMQQAIYKVVKITHLAVAPCDCFNSKRLSVTHVQTLKMKEEVLCVKYRYIELLSCCGHFFLCVASRESNRSIHYVIPTLKQPNI